MKAGVAIFFAVVTTAVAGGEFIELSRMSARNVAGTNVVSWTISSEAFSAQPSWDPLSAEPPLSPEAAIRAAIASLHGRGFTNEVQVAGIRLTPTAENKWIYWISFRPTAQLHGPDALVPVKMDGNVIEYAPVITNAVPPRRPFLREPKSPADPNTNRHSIAGMKGSYETVEGQIVRVFSVEDEGAKFRAYQVNWKEHEIIVQDTLGRTDKKEGDLLTFMVTRGELPHGNQKIRFLQFIPMEFGAHALPTAAEEAP